MTKKLKVFSLCALGFTTIGVLIGCGTVQPIEKYTITWKDGDGNVCQKDENISKGSDTPAYKSATPTKTATAEYTYTFDNGWATSPGGTKITTFPKVEADATYYALFTSSKNSYAITWMNGTAQLKQDTLEYGAQPDYEGEDPEKQNPEVGHTYTFDGWSLTDGGAKLETIPTVTGAASYYAHYTDVLNKYTITWKNGSSTLDSTQVEHGSVPTHALTATKEPTAQYTFEQDGWSLEDGGAKLASIPAATADATYYAHFVETVREYTISWKNEDGSALDPATTSVAYGTVPTYAGTPTKEPTAQYTYKFDGWSSEQGGAKVDPLPAVTGEATYYAHYSSTTNKYTVTFNSNGGSAVESQSIEYGSHATKPANPTKDYRTFDKWIDSDGNAVDFATYEVKSNVTFSATWKQNVYKVANVAYSGDDFQFKTSGFTKDQTVALLGTVSFVVNDDNSLNFLVGDMSAMGTDANAFKAALVTGKLQAGGEESKVVKFTYNETEVPITIVENEDVYSGEFTLTSTDVAGKFTFNIVKDSAPVYSTFVVNYDTKADGDLYIACDESNWSAVSSWKMTWTEGNNWTYTLPSPSGTTFAFKFVVKKGDSSLVWEAGDNRSMTLSETKSYSLTWQAE